MSYFDQIQKLAQYGLEFFPLFPNKVTGYSTPNNWNELGTSDLAQLQDWYDDPRYQGFAMVFKNQKAICFDLDVKNDINGVKNFKEVMAHYGIPEPNIIFKTPSGGLHVLFKHPGFETKSVAGYDFVKQMSKKSTGIDIRADGGLIATLGTYKNGRTYELIRCDLTVPLTELPQEFIDTLPKRDIYVSHSSAVSDGLKSLSGLTDFVDEQASVPMYGNMPEVILKGERDSTWTSLTASWARNSVPKFMMELAKDEFISRCDTPPDFNLQDKIESALSNPKVKYSRRDVDIDYLVKDLVFISSMNKYMFLHDRSIMNRAATSEVLGPLFVDVQVGEYKDGKPKFKRTPIFKLYSWQADKIIVSTIGYKPCNSIIYRDKIISKDVVNMYIPPNHKAVPDVNKLDLFFELAETICGSSEKGRVLCEFIAFLLQKPARKVGIALVIVTRQGVGKGLFLDVVSKLLGYGNVGIMHSDNISSNFNVQLSTNQLIVINESVGNTSGTSASSRKAKEFEGRSKAMITDYIMSVEKKGVDVEMLETFANFIYFSNEEAAVSFGEGDRRHMCFVNTDKPSNPEKFREFARLLQEEYISAIKHGLLTIERETIHEHMVHTSKTKDDSIVQRANLDGYSQEIFDDFNSSSIIFKSKFVSVNIFRWYCAFKFGMDIKKDSVYALRLFKENFERLSLNENILAAKEVTLEVPNMYINDSYGNSQVIGGREKHRVYVPKLKAFEEKKYGYNYELDEIKSGLLKCVNGLYDALNSKEDVTGQNLALVK